MLQQLQDGFRLQPGCEVPSLAECARRLGCAPACCCEAVPCYCAPRMGACAATVLVLCQPHAPSSCATAASFTSEPHAPSSCGSAASSSLTTGPRLPIAHPTTPCSEGECPEAATLDARQRRGFRSLLQQLQQLRRWAARDHVLAVVAGPAAAAGGDDA